MVQEDYPRDGSCGSADQDKGKRESVWRASCTALRKDGSFMAVLRKKWSPPMVTNARTEYVKETSQMCRE
jgi:hypothetical protein